MKKIILAIIAVTLIMSSYSQETDTTRFKLGKKEILIVDDEVVSVEKTDSESDSITDDEEDGDECDSDKGFEGHWAGLDLGLNTFLNNENTMDLPSDAEFLELNTGKSWGVGVNFFEKGINLYKGHIGIVTGLGFEINNYRFDKNITLNPDSSYITYVTDTILDFQKNKLTATYLNLPVILEFKIPVGRKDKSIHFAAGVLGGIKLGSHTKQVYEDNNRRHKDKVREDFHLSPFRYGLTARVGYSGLNLFATYHMSTLFEENEGPELYPFTVGIAFCGI